MSGSWQGVDLTYRLDGTYPKCTVWKIGHAGTIPASSIAIMFSVDALEGSRAVHSSEPRAQALWGRLKRM